MDPQAAWNRLLDAYSARDPVDAKDAADDLLVWLRSGGFPPQTLPNLPMDDAWNRTLAHAACRFVILECGRQSA